MARILVVDNYDSFVYNLVQYLYQLGARCEVRRNDTVSVAEADGFDGVLLSPGPGTPEQAGVCIDMVRHCAETGQPLFGVCLGLQSIGVAFGATVGRAPTPGQTFRKYASRRLDARQKEIPGVGVMLWQAQRRPALPRLFPGGEQCNETPC